MTLTDKFRNIPLNAAAVIGKSKNSYSNINRLQRIGNTSVWDKIVENTAKRGSKMLLF
jgi:hypothetical protein